MRPKTIAGLCVLTLLAGCAVTEQSVKSSSPADAARMAINNYARLLMVEKKATDAFATYYADELIQHDPWIDDGGAGDEAFLEERREAEPEKYDTTDQYVNVIHTIMADGDLVALKSHVFTSPNDKGRIFVDIWRLENGKFAEHWDVIQEISLEMRDFVGCGVGTTYAAAKARTPTVENTACGLPDRSVDSEESRSKILAYLEMGQQPGRLIEAIETYNHPDLVQHAKRIPGGRQGLVDYMTARSNERAADKRTSTIMRTIADGDMVLVHRRVTRDSEPTGRAIVDLFRLKDGKIIEHWDVVQKIPAFSVSGRSMVGGPHDPLEPGRFHGPPPAE